MDLLKALIGLVGVVVGVILTTWLSREIAKKAPKTDMRAKAYGDFVVHIMCDYADDATEKTPESDLNEITARLVVFGEEEVVCAVAEFLKVHRGRNSNEANEKIVAVIGAMRDSLETAHGTDVLEAIASIMKERPLR